MHAHIHTIWHIYITKQNEKKNHYLCDFQRQVRDTHDHHDCVILCFLVVIAAAAAAAAVASFLSFFLFLSGSFTHSLTHSLYYLFHFWLGKLFFFVAHHVLLFAARKIFIQCARWGTEDDQMLNACVSLFITHLLFHIMYIVCIPAL